jgi:putative PEP-CTERM system histidine kinase
MSMGNTFNQIAFYGHALAAVVHASFAAYLLVSARLTQSGMRSSRALVAALLVTAVWAALSGATEIYASSAWRTWAAVADLARYALWFAFLLQLLQADPQTASSTLAEVRPAANSPQLGRWWRVGAVAAVSIAAITLWSDGGYVLPTQAPRASIAVGLALPLLGILAVEQLFRNIGEDARWGAKPLCLGLACVFVFDVYLFSEALLFARVDEDAYGLRGAVHALAVPFLWVAARRRTDWIQRLQVSRKAAFYSATLVLAGGYLLFMSAIGYYVRYFGGTWGRALQVGLLAVAVAILVALLFSGSLRAWIKVFVGKHFYAYRYDYRDEWLRFTAMLSSRGSPQETGALIVSGLARMVECPAGSLWTRASADAPYTEAARWNMQHNGGEEPADSAFCSLMQDKGWVIDLEEYRTAPRRYAGMIMPTWLLASANPWLVVPLLVDGEMLGFVVLARPRTAVDLNWELLDLLKTAGRQAAGYLAQMQATEALLEARKFEAFNRMSAFVVHDLKNIVTQLSLMLKNAERLRDNREFQEDMLLTVESSLEKMRRLMLQLREGATPVGAGRGVELAPIVTRLQALAAAQGRSLQVQKLERLATRGHEDRLERVLGHLVQNALDATPPQGTVWVCVERYSGQVKVDVGDTGSGMTEEFIQSKLFKPFSTTKRSGMGIGTYESHQYVRELGGSIQVRSQVHEGTVVTVLLPVFEVQAASDLLRSAAP